MIPFKAKYWKYETTEHGWAIHQYQRSREEIIVRNEARVKSLSRFPTSININLEKPPPPRANHAFKYHENPLHTPYLGPGLGVGVSVNKHLTFVMQQKTDWIVFLIIDKNPLKKRRYHGKLRMRYHPTRKYIVLKLLYLDQTHFKRFFFR